VTRTVFLLVIAGFVLTGLAACQGSDDPVITPAATHARLGQDSLYLFLDVRTQQEFDGPSGHVPGSILIPVQELEARLSALATHKDKTIIAICRSGNRSGMATRFLRGQGFEAVNMTGGMNRWNAEALPTHHTENK
jgi:rhodanese-related sulfurtransferase